MGFNNELRSKPFIVFYNTIHLKDDDHFVTAFNSHEEATGTVNAELKTVGIILNDYPILGYTAFLTRLLGEFKFSHVDLHACMQQVTGRGKGSYPSGPELIEIVKRMLASSLYSRDSYYYQDLMIRNKIYGYRVLDKNGKESYKIFKLVFNPYLINNNTLEVTTRRINNSVRSSTLT